MTDVRASFPPLLASATDARHVAEQALSDWQLDVVRDEVRLLVSELVINAVLHAGTPVTLVMASAGGRLRVEVSDGSTVEPVVREPNPTSPTGRGLQILANLSDDWGVEIREHGADQGKTVWFELRARPAGSEGASGASARLAGGDGRGGDHRSGDGATATPLHPVGGASSTPSAFDGGGAELGESDR